MKAAVGEGKYFQNCITIFFLETVPPNQEKRISDMFVQISGRIPQFNEPELQLHCTHEACNGLRSFRCIDSTLHRTTDDLNYLFLEYACSNCKQSRKLFSLFYYAEDNSAIGYCTKIGEAPVYGPPTPTKLITLIGPDREIFLKGRRCENQGLGIGAFAEKQFRNWIPYQ
jgi:hypothetical protein